MSTRQDPLSGLGGRIRTLRKAQGIRLNELASKAGLSDAFLSRLERGQVSSSVANLIQIAQVLDVGMGELFEREPDATRSSVTVHRVGKPDGEQYLPSTGYRWRLLAGGMPHDDFEVFHLVFPRKNRMELMVSHPGQEYCFVISGQVRFIIGSETFDLGPEEGIFLNSQLPHRSENIGQGDARILLVVSKTESHGEHFDWWKTPADASSLTGPPGAAADDEPADADSAKRAPRRRATSQKTAPKTKRSRAAKAG